MSPTLALETRNSRSRAILGRRRWSWSNSSEGSPFRWSFIQGGGGCPEFVVGAPIWSPSRPPVTGAGIIDGFVGWTGMNGCGGGGEGTGGWFTRGRGVGGGTAELICTNLVTSVVAI